ncbi:MAG: hypothetical protein MZV63_57765 [Marinilabiliales bacterium]|nr:hypothetical protein [Marinilabiliales bacterium]
MKRLYSDSHGSVSDSIGKAKKPPGPGGFLLHEGDGLPYVTLYLRLFQDSVSTATTPPLSVPRFPLESMAKVNVSPA